MRKIINYMEEKGTEVVMLALVTPVVLAFWVLLFALIREVFF